MADSKISALTDGGGFQAGDAIPIDRSATNYRVSPIGVPVLIYRYTVTGSDKASIDTGVDTANAGSNDWTNGDILEIFAALRTDDAAGVANVDVRVNNDSGANYDTQYLYGIGTSAGAGESLGATFWGLTVHGSGGSSGYPAVYAGRIPDYTNTVFNKVCDWDIGIGDSNSGVNHYAMRFACGWRSTAAITRLKVAAESTAKLKVGSQLLIYKRLAS